MSAICAAEWLVPSTGRSSATALRGMPRMRCSPNRRPRPCTCAANGPNPAPSTADGNRSGAGDGYPCSSTTNGASTWYPWDRAVGSYQSMSTTTVSYPTASNRSAITVALARTSSSVTVVPKQSQLFQPCGGFSMPSLLIARRLLRAASAASVATVATVATAEGCRP